MVVTFAALRIRMYVLAIVIFVIVVIVIFQILGGEGGGSGKKYYVRKMVPTYQALNSAP